MFKRKKWVTSLSDQLFFTLPTMFVFSITIVIPFVYGLFMTFMDMPMATSPLKFAGLGNYQIAFKDEGFWKSILLTLEYVVASVFFVNMIGFALAYLVTSGIKAQNFFRTSLFTPNLIGGLVLGYIWQFIFVQTLPVVGEKLGIELLRLGWLGDERMAFWALVIVTVWQLSGYMMLIYVAGLVSIPKDVIEASTIDGANTWQKLTKVTLPLMMPAFVVSVFLTLRNTFMVYDLNLSLTAGGPYDSTKMAMMHVVNKAFAQTQYSVGQAEAIFLFIVVAIIAGVQVYIGKKKEVEA